MDKTEALKRLEAIESGAQELRKIIEQKEHTTERWRAEKGDEYWYIDDCGDYTTAIEDNYKIDDYRHTIGNYFKTEEEAEKWKLWHETICEMNTWHDEEGEWYIHWSDVRKEYIILSANKKTDSIRFSTIKKAQEFMEHFKDKLDIVYR